MSTIASYSPLTISETVRDRSLVPKEMAYGESDGHVTLNFILIILILIICYERSNS